MKDFTKVVIVGVCVSLLTWYISKRVVEANDAGPVGDPERRPPANGVYVIDYKSLDEWEGGYG